MDTLVLYLISLFSQVFILVLTSWTSLCLCQKNSSLMNSTDPNKDMYVIHAMVYQVGIITNKSDEEIANMTGNQEALTFYHSNGSNVNLSDIPKPLVTNVTAQSLVGVAPTSDGLNGSDQLPWSTLNQLTSINQSSIRDTPDELKNMLTSNNNILRNQTINVSKRNVDFLDPPFWTMYKRSLKDNATTDARTSIKVVKETAVIPPEAGLQSIGLPAILGLNNNLSSLPIPIPNTSVLHYAKVSTVVKTP